MSLQAVSDCVTYYNAHQGRALKYRKKTNDDAFDSTVDINNEAWDDIR